MSVDSNEFRNQLFNLGPFSRAMAEFENSVAKETGASKAADTETLNLCVACRCQIKARDTVTFRCGDHWCGECLESRFKLSLKDEMVFPPRCCYHIISVKEVQKHLSRALIREFQSRQLELRTKDKTYCHRLTCSAFIAPHSIHNGEAICQKCTARTCAKCKGKWHYGPCSAGDNAEFMEFASQNTWKRCPQCKRMVEKDDGCNHMMCRCGCEFCYGCGNKYFKCSCVHSEDEIDIADDVTDISTSDESEQPETALERHQRQEHQDYLAVSARRRQFQCGFCDRSFYNWISRCVQCELNICNYCR